MPLVGIYEPSTSPFARDQAELFESTDGVEGATWQGRPVVVLTSVGAKSGALRKTVLMRVEHDGSYAAVASQDGAPTHPLWYWNLLKHPHVELQDGPDKKDFTARLITGHDRAKWWERAVGTWPDYAAYQTRTSREIPVFLLTPVVA